MRRSARVTGLFVVALVLATTACGAKRSTSLTLHAPAHHTIALKVVKAGESVVCVTHGTRIRGELPDRASSANSTAQASGVDYANASGGTMSISSNRTSVTITCR